VKIDILGNRSLALVRDAIRHVNKTDGEQLNYQSLNPLTDEKTTRLLARGDTMGIFYVESPAMRQLQCKAGTGDYESLVIHSSIIRPAANQWISEYIERIKSGEYPRIHPVFDEMLSETHGILCYQEDVMRVAGELAGFDHGDADRLRRTLTKKSSVPLHEIADRFIVGLKKSGLSDDQARHVWKMMESFGGYSFCKAHSASYALVSFKAAYLKAHYPAEFMAALISNGGGYYTSQAYISELRRMGLGLLPPDINEAQSDFMPCGNAIRVGLRQIKGLGEDDIQRIREARSEYPIASLEDLWNRCSLSTTAVRGLILAGSLDSIHGPGCRVHLLREMAGYTSKTSTRQPLALVPVPPRIYHDIPNEDYYRFQELDILGFTLKGHPLDLVGQPTCTSIKASELERHIGSRITLPGWMVTTKPVRTRAGDDMAFVSFEDTHAIYETVLFPRSYRRYGELLRTGRPYVIRGEVTEEWGSITITVEHIMPIQFSPPWISDEHPDYAENTYPRQQRGKSRRTA
jgi:DNA polymerase III alpha subunit